MIKATIVHNKNEKKSACLGQALFQSFTGFGWTVSILDLDDETVHPQKIVSCFSSADLIVIGGETLTWSGKVSQRLINFIKECSYIEGRKIVVYSVKTLFGSQKALKKLMKAVEERGGFLADFEVLSNVKDCVSFSKRMLSLIKN